MIQGRFFTAANMISILRIPLAAAAAIFLWQGNRLMVGLFMLLASLSDAADGMVARKTDTVSDWGKLLDPAADKIAFAVMAVTMFYLNLISPWLLWMLIIRDGLIIAGGILLSSKTRPPSANALGKASTLVLALYMIRQAVFPHLQIISGELLFDTDLLGVVSASLILVSFASYIGKFLKSDGKVHAS